MCVHVCMHSSGPASGFSGLGERGSVGCNGDADWPLSTGSLVSDWVLLSFDCGVGIRWESGDHNQTQ